MPVKIGNIIPHSLQFLEVNFRLLRLTALNKDNIFYSRLAKFMGQLSGKQARIQEFPKGGPASVPSLKVVLW